MREGKALKEEDVTYYDELKVRLDLVLTFTEQGELSCSRERYLTHICIRRLRTDIPIYRPARPPRDTNHKLMLAYILLD